MNLLGNEEEGINYKEITAGVSFLILVLSYLAEIRPWIMVNLGEYTTGLVDGSIITAIFIAAIDYIKRKIGSHLGSQR